MTNGRSQDSSENGVLTQSNTFNIAAKLNFDDVLWLVVFFWQYKNEAAFEETEK